MTKQQKRKRASETKKPARLEPDLVVRRALDLLDEVGLDGLSVRRLADALGVQNPALYWHFKNKQELLDRMAAKMIHDGFGAVEGPVGVSWNEWLRLLARVYRRVLLSRRDGARVLASADLFKADLLPGLDRSLAFLQNAGFRGRDALTGILAIFDYTLGTTLEKQVAAPRGGREDSSMLRRRVDATRLPALAAVLDEIAAYGSPNSDETFEAGIGLIVDGLRLRLEPRTG